MCSSFRFGQAAVSLRERPHHQYGRRGFSLIELVIVLTILSVTAIVAMPSVAPNQSVDLDVATTQISEAMRFARDESIRTGVRHGVELDPSALTLKVFRAAAGTTRTFDVQHPLTRRTYEVALVRSARARDLVVTPAATWSGSCSAADDIGFDTWGLPRCANDWNARLTTFTVTLNLRGEQSAVGVQSATGRVAVL